MCLGFQIIVYSYPGRSILVEANCTKHNWYKIATVRLRLSEIQSSEWREEVMHANTKFRPRPQVTGYFVIRNFFFPDTAIVHTHTGNSQANPEIFESLSIVEIFESDNISDTCGRSNPDIF